MESLFCTAICLVNVRDVYKLSHQIPETLVPAPLTTANPTQITLSQDFTINPDNKQLLHSESSSHKAAAMGGKGRRRREKNYLAAHGGHKRLPPPPNAKEHEALPSKLRKIMEFKNSSAEKYVDTIGSAETRQGKRKDESCNKKKSNLKESQSAAVNIKLGGNINEKAKSNLLIDKSGSAESSSADVRKRKRKRNSVKDLRFEALGQLAIHSKRKERKKEYLKGRKNKHKKVKADDALDFPGRENIRFGEVVEAPPKLSLPKVSKTSTMDASKERLRLQAVELYRKRRGWESRPGIKLPL